MKLKVLAFAVILVAGLVGGPLLVGEPRADAVSCAVRGAIDRAGNNSVYIVRNQCTATYSFKVYLPIYQRYAISGQSSSGAACRAIGGGTAGTFWYTVPDNGWTVSAC